MAIRGLGIRIARTAGRAKQLLLVPLLTTSEEILIGGQAVIEGVMMRSPQSYAVAVRRPSGTLAVTQDSVRRPAEKHRIFKYPIFRGLGTLGQALVLGLRALHYSAQQALEEPGDAPAKKKGKLSGWVLALNLAFSLSFFVLFYKFLPLYLATLAKQHHPIAGNLIVFNLLDGTIRLVLFLVLLIALAQWKDVQRLFEYHGAEHKAVWAYEKGGPVDIPTARGCSRFHPRCGTSFLLVVMGVAMIVYLFLPFQSFVAKFVWRLLLLPVIAGLSYEVIRFAARKQGSLWRWVAQPGLWLQRVTTREPDDSQLETAITALETTMELERSRGGELVIA
jgi:uncharacterized protein YqhQ